MKKTALIVIMLVAGSLSAQTIYSSRNGYIISPHMKMRMLNLFVNIIYDQTPERDPMKNDNQYQWKPGKPNSINSNVPAFLKGFMDPDYTGQPLKSIISGYFFESSLGNFICLGDFVMVNVLQSRITPDKPGRSFSQAEIVKQAIIIINENGGLQTVFGHNHISDFDFFDRGSAGLPKKVEPNGKIDFIQAIFRNTGKFIENGVMVANYGHHNPGEGTVTQGNICSDCKIKIGNSYYENDMYSYQNLGWDNFIYPGKNIAIHEFAHLFLGGNEFHTSGGNHYGTYSACTFMGLQGGWGIIGGYNSSLISCNGYERLRLGWFDSIQNPNLFKVAASGQNADIKREDGAKSFILRDFISTGDAIRIKLPCVDSGASNQYIWLENHQVGKNNRLDYLNYSNSSECRDKGSAGIYSYIQVGRDVLESENFSEVFSSDETDNLKVISAKGNWDRKLESLTDTLNCVAWKKVVRSESYHLPNPLSGYNDQQSHFFDLYPEKKLIINGAWVDFSYIIYKNGQSISNLPNLGDNYDAFTGNTLMNIGTNPSPSNTATCYVTLGNGNFKTYNKVNTRNIYLTGLSIDMKEQSNGNFQVDIRWDDYLIRNNIRWTGSIILKENLEISKGKNLLLDINYTPCQLNRDPTTGLFTPPTRLSAEDGSKIIVNEKSKIVLDNQSTMIIGKGSELILKKGSVILVKNRSRLIIDKACKIINQGGKIQKTKNGIIEYR